jgi:ribose transport system substrate-binding protein
MMKIRYFGISALSALVVGAVAVAGVGGSALAQDKSKGALNVAIFSVNGASPTIHTMIESATEAAKSRGWTVETFDGNGDQVATNNQANTFITRGFNALINIASDNHQMGAVIENAKKAGIPFVSTFSGMVPGITVDIGSNNTVDGAIAATELVARIDGKGHIVKMNWNVLPALQERDRGFQAAVKGYPDIKVTEIEVKVPGQVDDTYNQLTNLLSSNKDIIAVWTGWDEIAIAAVRAIEQAKRANDIFVVSMDGNSAAYDLIRQGAPLALTVAYDVRGMGVEAVKAAADAVDGKKFVARQLFKKPCLISKATIPSQGSQPDFKSCPLFSADIPK